MTSLPPLASVQAGSASGGGLLSSITGALSGASGAAAGAATQQSAGGAKGDGSVGLFDGVLTKALMGGAVGAGVGFLPFLPGGPLLGGVVGALLGAGYGMFKNYKEMKAIKEENAAFLAQMGVNPASQEQANALLSGNPGQLLQMGGAPTQSTAQTAAQTGAATSTAQTGVAQQSSTPDQMSSVMGSSWSPETAKGGIVIYDASGTQIAGPTSTAQTSAQTGQTAPPAVVDATTQPATQSVANIAPVQAGVTNGGGADPVQAAADAAALAKEDADKAAAERRQRQEDQEREVKQLNNEIAALRAQIARLEAQYGSAVKVA